MSKFSSTGAPQARMHRAVPDLQGRLDWPGRDANLAKRAGAPGIEAGDGSADLPETLFDLGRDSWTVGGETRYAQGGFHVSLGKGQGQGIEHRLVGLERGLDVRLRPGAFLVEAADVERSFCSVALVIGKDLGTIVGDGRRIRRERRFRRQTIVRGCTQQPDDFDTWLTGNPDQASTPVQTFPAERTRIVLQGVGEKADLGSTR
jgi:hypothetical protein